MLRTHEKPRFRFPLPNKLRRWWRLQFANADVGSSVTKLSPRDSRIVSQILADEDAEPNEALRAAASRFKEVGV
jgi:hypothetical protein